MMGTIQRGCRAMHNRLSTYYVASFKLQFKTGIPHPPTGLQLNTSSGGELGTYVFKLTWTPLRTLLDKSDSNRQELIYVVHVYIGLNSSSRLLYRIETTLSSINITLKDLNTYNVTACNLSTVNFYVSAKFEEIGEGNVSSPVGFDSRDAEDICKTGKCPIYSMHDYYS